MNILSPVTFLLLLLATNLPLQIAILATVAFLFILTKNSKIKLTYRTFLKKLLKIKFFKKYAYPLLLKDNGMIPVISTFLGKNSKKITLILLLPFLIIILHFMYRSYLFLQFPYEYDPYDGVHAVLSIRLFHLENLYAPEVDYPYLPTPYPPIYYLISALFVPFLKDNIFLGCRLVSITSALLIGAITYVLVFSETKRRLWAFVSSILFFSLHSVFEWSFVCRPDTLGIFLMLAGIYFILNHSRKNYLVYAAFSFFLGFYAKQSLLSAPLASFIYLLFTDRRKAVSFGFVYTILMGSAFYALNYLTDGQFYIHTIKIPGTLGISLGSAINSIYDYYVKMHFILVAFAVLYAITHRKSLLSWYYLISLIGLVSIGKPGSFFNYFIENLAVVCILVGIQSNELLQHKHKLLENIVLILLLYSLFNVQRYDFNLFDSSKNPLLTEKNLDAVSEYVGGIKGEIISDAGSFALYNNKTYALDSIAMLDGIREKSWDYSKVRNDCFNKKFDSIILRKHTFMTAIIGDCLKGRYAVAREMPGGLTIDGNNEWLIYLRKKTVEKWRVSQFYTESQDRLFGESSDGWSEVHTADGKLDFIKIFGQQDKVYVYARTYVYSPRSENVNLQITSDDGESIVSLNGGLFVANQTNSPYPVSLNSGWNMLTVRVYNGWGLWYMKTELTAADSELLDGLVIDANGG